MISDYWPCIALVIFHLFQPGCNIRNANTPIGDRKMFSFLASKLKCKFIYEPKKNDKKTEEVNLDVIHDRPKIEDLIPRPPVVTIGIKICIIRHFEC